MLSIRDLIVYGRSFIQDTIDVLDFRVGSLASSFVDTDKNNSDNVSCGNTPNFLEVEKMKEFDNMDQNRNGFFPRYKKEEETLNNSPACSTNTITKESTAKRCENHAVVLQPNHYCSKSHPPTENGHTVRSKSKNLKCNFSTESKDVKIVIDDELYSNGSSDLFPIELERNLINQTMLETNGFYLNVSIPERKLSYTEAILQNEMDSYGLSSLLDSLSLDSDEKNGDDMNEMEMPNPGSIQHF